MAFAIFRTFARVSALRRPLALSALEAVPIETPASRATSRRVLGAWRGAVIFERRLVADKVVHLTPPDSKPEM